MKDRQTLMSKKHCVGTDLQLERHSINERENIEKEGQILRNKVNIKQFNSSSCKIFTVSVTRETLVETRSSQEIEEINIVRIGVARSFSDSAGEEQTL